MSDVKTYTESRVSEAANAARDLIIQEIECDIDSEDLLSLLVNATISVLTSGMSADLDEVVRENYGESLDEYKAERGF
ncbi:hypothetical protein OHB13_11990 [Streptomyces sp. NBC_00440]|uniref:hypothetical protein n=1 Tax=Streptomyces sp. NBC_00440 TaxID=2975741 RepID=UPI002E20CF3A